MRKIITLIAISLTLVQFAQSQTDESIQPKSFSFSERILTRPEEIILPKFNYTDAMKMDEVDRKNGHLPLVARNIDTDIRTEQAGTWSTLPNGDRIWRVKVTSSEALGLSPLFDKLFLPEGSSLHFYMPGKEEVLGAFTHYNTPEPRAFCPGLLHGETCIIEYFEPAVQKGNGIISINKIGHAYRWIDPLEKSNNSSGACEVNINCPEGSNWQDQKRSVVKIFIVSGGGNGYCSGALINNVRQDCTPYILSAQHCSEGGVTAAQYNQWVFYFNYESSTCTGTTGPQNHTVNGCTKVADSQDNGGATGSDFLFLLLNSAPLASYNAYYSGWDNRTGPPNSGVDIHHPNADIKKISTYSAPATSVSWGGNVQNTHWEINFVATTSGHGVTEPGSSGSPMYNENGLIVGHLTGGGSCCPDITGANCSILGMWGPDDYGKLAYDWTSNGATNNVRLKPWLDPDNIGTNPLPGMNPPCGSGLADDAGIQFITSPKGNLCSGTFTPTVILKNFGTNSITFVTINYTIDGTPYTHTWSGTLAAGATVIVSLPSVTLAPGTHIFVSYTSNPNGNNDSYPANDSQTSTFVIAPAAGNLNLYLHTDSYGSQTTWDITNNTGTVVYATGGPYNDVTNGQTFNIPVCLAPGCYIFDIYDVGGDGMSGGGNSGFTLSGPGGNPVYASLTNQNFGNQEQHSFCIAGSGVNEVNDFRVIIVPNPSTGVFSLTFDYQQEKSVRVFDDLGRKIVETKTNDTNFNLDLSGNNAGVYILQVETNSGKAIQKLILK